MILATRVVRTGIASAVKHAAGENGHWKRKEGINRVQKCVSFNIVTSYNTWSVEIGR